ncbi:hypothetical protein V865_003779 [Kwoniella europaea PYCC6329]|uniref:DUF7918 domain-containing protein n=1 Tax=Kwoniella europaea PYCC6329 TaxID=1423913 RepID=A0AAX4KI01_9TREE
MFSSNGSLESWIEGKSTQKRLNEHCIEYKPPSKDTGSITSCFLETSPEPFVIRLKRSENLFPGDDFRAICEVDGKDIGFSIWRADRLEYEWKAVWERRDGDLYQSSLKFDTLATTDDPSKVDISVRDLENIGTIVITLTRGTTRTSRKRNEIELFNRVKGKAMENQGFLSSVGTTESVKGEEWQPVFYDFTPSGSGIPYHQFVFKYRPARVLKFLGLIDQGHSSLSSRSYAYQTANIPLFLPASSSDEESSASTSAKGTQDVGSKNSNSEDDRNEYESSQVLVKQSPTESLTNPESDGRNTFRRRYSLRPSRKRTYVDEEQL